MSNLHSIYVLCSGNFLRKLNLPKQINSVIFTNTISLESMHLNSDKTERLASLSTLYYFKEKPKLITSIPNLKQFWMLKKTHLFLPITYIVNVEVFRSIQIKYCLVRLTFLFFFKNLFILSKYIFLDVPSVIINVIA